MSDQGTGQRQSAFHSPGEISDLGVSSVSEADTIETFMPTFSTTIVALEPLRIGERISDAHVPGQARILRQVADSGQLTAFPLVPHLSLAQTNGPAPRPEVPDQGADQGCLACAIEPEKRRNAALEGAGDVEEDLPAAVSLSQPFDPDISIEH